MKPLHVNLAPSETPRVLLRCSPLAPAQMALEKMPLVLVKYCGLQEGFGQLAPQALFNVVGGQVPDLMGSTVTLPSLVAKGYRIKEAK